MVQRKDFVDWGEKLNASFSAETSHLHCHELGKIFSVREIVGNILSVHDVIGKYFSIGLKGGKKYNSFCVFSALFQECGIFKFLLSDFISAGHL